MVLLNFSNKLPGTGRIPMVVLLCLGTASLLTISCKKFVEVNPTLTQPSAQVVYNSNATAASVLTGIYADLANISIANGSPGISLIGGVAADELKAFPPTQTSILSAYTNALSATDNVPFWTRLYYYVYTTNSVLENLENSPAVTSTVKQQLRGEAKFMRAFCYFYLINFFGDVPLILTTDYRANASSSRTDKAKIWEQIIADLKDAQSSLSPSYVEADVITTKSTTARVRPNKWAATALLARAYLYTNYWSNAEAQATEVINNSGVYQLESDLDNAFLKDSKEAILQIQPVQPDYNTFDGFVFVLTNSPDYSSPVTISDFLLNAFEPGDNRVIQWIGSFTDGGGTTYRFPYKYKVKVGSSVTEYLMVLRLAELYLIRAEARAQQDKVNEATEDLNVIRSRAGLPAISAITKEELLDAILQERRVELFTEWAHRWLDLKRTGKVDAVMAVVTPQKGGTWSTNWQWFPIPFQSTILANPNISQNLGY